MTSIELSALLNSLLVATGALALSLPGGVWLGWLLARRRFRGKAVVEGLTFLPLVLPPVVVGYLLLVLFGRNGWIGGWFADHLGWSLVFSRWGMTLAAAVVGFPLLVRSVRTAMENVDPGLVEAARTLGCSRRRAFTTITLPLARSGILAGAVLAFARGIGEFGATVMVAANTPGNRTLALEIFREASVPGGEVAVARLAGLSIVLSLAALLLAEGLAARGRRGAS